MRADQVEEQADGGRLAGAVWAEEAEDLPFRDNEIKVEDSLLFAVGLRQLLCSHRIHQATPQLRRVARNRESNYYLRVTRTNASAPARPSLRQLKKQRTREAIVDAALRLFREHGYAATTCDQIAEAAGVSPATFFRYFPTKEDVVLQDDYDALIVAMVAARPAEEPPVVAVRKAMAAGFALILPQDEQAIRERVLLTLSVPALRARIYEQQQAAEANFAAAIAPRMGADDDGASRARAGGGNQRDGGGGDGDVGKGGWRARRGCERRPRRARGFVAPGAGRYSNIHQRRRLSFFS